MRVLVANRGEIAQRLIQALNELQIESVAIHTPSDSLHTVLATHTVEIPNAACYMKVQEMIRIAIDNKCTAIVPGYGFLSESSELAQACSNAGLVFCGPSAQVLRDLGDKTSAKRIAKKMGIPILPSHEVESFKDIEKFASTVQYPIMLKAQDGGGGKGIRIVRQRDEIQPLMEEALNESPSRQLFAEKAALEGFKHIEVQVVADRHGNVRTVFERECSLQRRFQKVIEIAPSSLPRARIVPLEEAATSIAKHVGYVGLGTFEFLVNARGQDFYFMECNPRIQVEHSITEQIAGLDLAHLLFQITLQDLNLEDTVFAREPYGCSIQCRVNAEDPTTFLPSQGSTNNVSLPAGPGVRVDSVLWQLRPGATYTTSDEYDSLVAKIITTATTYDLALRKAIGAIPTVNIDGFKTNQTLLIGLLNSELMTKPAKADIRSLSQQGLVQALVASGSDALAGHTDFLSSRLNLASAAAANSPTMLGGSAPSILKKGDAFAITMTQDKQASTTKEVKIEKILKNNFPEQLSLVASIDGKAQTIYFEKSSGSANHRKADPLNTSHIASPFAGILVELLVDAGDEAEEAETIAIFRQGKMELDVRAPYAGTISEVAHIKEGEAVGVGALIAIISPNAPSSKL